MSADANETGRPVVYDLDPDCTADDIEEDDIYHATVNGVVDYGVFVDLSENVSGLVHESSLDRSYDVGDELLVTLENVRENGDLAFDPVELEEYDTVAIAHAYERTAAGSLSEASGQRVHLEGSVVQIKQTGGPTIFHVCDETGVAPCAAFEAAGVRAHPEIELDDVVHVVGTAEERDGAYQVEVETLELVSGEEAEFVRKRLEAGLAERAEPADVEPLIEWPAMNPLLSDLREVARLLRLAVLEGRPIRIRHHADGDGICASIPVHLALERFAAATHEDPEAPRHLLRRLPSKAPFYELEDATRDLNYALEDRARHGQKLPLLLMLDNGSTEEDVPAYRTLAHYDVPIVAIDHHHPDPEAVDPLLDAHVNPYLHGEDYRITTGMLCVELARMIDPSLGEELRHLPAVAGVSDRSKADAMEDYLALAEAEGYDEETIYDISDAIDYAAFWLKYDPGRGLLDDVLDVDCDDHDRHREAVSFLAERARRDIDEQLDAALSHVERDELANGAHLVRVDVEHHAHRFTYPAPGKTTGAIHDHVVEESGDPVVTIGVGPDFAVLRSDGVRLDIPEMVTELIEELPGAGVSGGGHLVVGSIKYVSGMRETVLDLLVEKMGEAEIDEELGSVAGVSEKT